MMPDAAFNLLGYGHGMLGILIFGVLLVVPFWIILPRFGVPSWAAIAAMVPAFAVVLLWLMAVKEMMNRRGGQS